MGFTYQDNLTTALRAYLDIRKNVDPATEVKRRAKNITLRLIKIYGDAAPTKEEIAQVVKSLGFNVKTRQRILNKKGLSRKRQVILELRARQGARKFTATGWFPAVKALGGTARLKGGGHPGGVIRGKLISKLGGSNPSITFINEQPGAKQTDQKAQGAVKRAFELETADMIKYIDRKQKEAAKKAGLMP